MTHLEFINVTVPYWKWISCIENKIQELLERQGEMQDWMEISQEWRVNPVCHQHRAGS